MAQESHCNWWQNMGPPLLTGEQTSEYRMEIPNIFCKNEVQASINILTVFWDSQGPVFEHCQEVGMTINRARYSEMLAQKAIRSKWKVSCQNMFCCCMTVPVPMLLPSVETLQQLYFAALNLLRQIFLNCELKEAVYTWLVTWSKKHFFFWWFTEACATVAQVYWKARGVCWSIMHLWVMCFCFFFNKYVANFFCFTLICMAYKIRQ